MYTQFAITHTNLWISTWKKKSNSHSSDADKWEEELQRDLQEFELVSGDVSALDEETLDEEIKEMRMSANKTKVNK